MNTPSRTRESVTHAEERWAILVHSIGSSGAGLVKALKQISPLSEQKIASMLYQTPTKLFTDLPEKAAKDIHQLLETAGLECEVIGNDTEVETGDSDHEIALVIKEVSRMTEVAQLIMGLIGADIETVRKMLFTTPTVLLGKISKNTASAIRKRFEALDVEVDISQPSTALFDVFLGTCTEMDIHTLRKIFEGLNIELVFPDGQIQGNSLVSAGISREDANHIWEKINRTSLPVKIVNRDFERFDLLLDAMSETNEAIEYLTTSTGMPEQIAQKVVKKLPIVIHQNISFSEMEKQVAQVVALGGKATGNLLVFQTFSIQLENIKDIKKTINILHALGGQAEASIAEAIKGGKQIDGPFTNLQSKWIQHELKQIGTTSSRTLR